MLNRTTLLALPGCVNASATGDPERGIVTWTIFVENWSLECDQDIETYCVWIGDILGCQEVYLRNRGLTKSSFQAVVYTSRQTRLF